MAASGNRLLVAGLECLYSLLRGQKGPRWWPRRCSPAGLAGGWAATRRPWPSAGSRWPRWPWPPPPGSPTRWCWSPPGPPGHGLAARLVTDPGEGPLAALAAALGSLDTGHVLVLAGDHLGRGWSCSPHLTGLAGRGQAVACRRGPRLEPLVAVYERAPALAAARARLADRGGDRSLLGLLAGLRTVVVEEAEWRTLDPDGRSFVDLDDPADLAAWHLGAR